MLFYLFAEPLMKRFLPLIWRRLCLSIVAVFYLYPFAYLCNRYRIWLATANVCTRTAVKCACGYTLSTSTDYSHRYSGTKCLDCGYIKK